MRRDVRTWLAGAGLLLGAAWPAAGDEPLGPMGARVLDLLAAGVPTLSVVAAGDGLSWVAWDDADGAAAVHLALVRREGGGASVIWSARREAAYAPSLQTLPDGAAANGPVLLLRFHYGAAAMRAELYGRDTGGRPVLLGEVEGAAIEAQWADGRTRLRVFPRSDLRGPPRCFGWSRTARALRPQRCGSGAGR